MDDRIPTAILESLNLYHREGIPTGGFLEAVLANDLTGAIGRADENSLNALRSIVRHIYVEMPSVLGQGT